MSDEIEEFKASMQAFMLQMREDHKNRMKQIDEDHKNRMKQIDEDHKNRMKQIDEDHKKEMKQIDEDHKKEMKQIDEDHKNKNRMKQISANHQNETTKAKVNNNDIANQHTNVRGEYRNLTTQQPTQFKKENSMEDLKRKQRVAFREIQRLIIENENASTGIKNMNKFLNDHKSDIDNLRYDKLFNGLKEHAKERTSGFFSFFRALRRKEWVKDLYAALKYPSELKNIDELLVKLANIAEKKKKEENEEPTSSQNESLRKNI